MTIRGLANKGLTIKGAAAAATTSTSTQERIATTSTPNRSFTIQQQQSRTGGILDRISSPKQQQQQPQQEHNNILNRISSPSSSPTTNKSAAIMSHLNKGRQVGGIKNRLSSPSSSPSIDNNNNNNNRLSPLNRIGRQRGKEQEESMAPSPVVGGGETSVPTTGKSSTLLIKNLSDSTTESDIREFGQAIPGGITHITFDKQQAKVTLKDPQSAVLFRRKYNRTSLKGSHIIISFS
ncbi:hypothetical protein BDC45DRAFT_521459 [Circinella umbellata]|nr:hypothetical protein BDC45DRAFT_521459 [Circinella umbellata]